MMVSMRCMRSTLLIHCMIYSAPTWQAKKPVQQLLPCARRGTKSKTTTEKGKVMEGVLFIRRVTHHDALYLVARRGIHVTFETRSHHQDVLG